MIGTATSLSALEASWQRFQPIQTLTAWTETTNSARLLPENDPLRISPSLPTQSFTRAQAWSPFGAMLKHANLYGLKYVFVHDSYYEPPAYVYRVEKN